MQIIRLEKAKEYCDKHNVERNAWVAGAIDKVIAGTHEIRYESELLLMPKVTVVVNLEYIHSHMQSLKGFDKALNVLMVDGIALPLKDLQRKQAMLTIGELADDFEIGIA